MQEKDLKPGDKVFFIAESKILKGEIEEIKVYRTKDEEKYSFDVKTEKVLYLRVEKVFESRSELLRALGVEDSEAVELLRKLCELKDYRDKKGEDFFYSKHQKELWKAAKDLLDRIEK